MGNVPLMGSGDERFGKQDSGPWLDVAEAFRPPANPLRTFREHVEAGDLPRGYERMLVLQPQEDGSLVIQLSRQYLGELASVDLATLMAGTKLTWRCQLEPSDWAVG